MKAFERFELTTTIPGAFRRGEVAIVRDIRVKVLACEGHKITVRRAYWFDCMADTWAGRLRKLFRILRGEASQ